jgi:hypothetical protein
MKHSERGDDRLTRSLRMLGEIEATSKPSSRVETALMARWDAEHDPHRRSRSRTRRMARMATTVAAGVTLAGALGWQRASDLVVRLRPDTTNDATGTVSGVSQTSRDEFTTVAVVGGPLMAGEPVRVVRMRVARSVLGELGIPSPAQRGAARAETVDIDVLVGEDGVARGVRVPISEL